MSAEDADALRARGFSDACIHDAIQVVCYLNYVNRVADAVGIEDEPGVGGPDAELDSAHACGSSSSARGRSARLSWRPSTTSTR